MSTLNQEVIDLLNSGINLSQSAKDFVLTTINSSPYLIDQINQDVAGRLLTGFDGTKSKGFGGAFSPVSDHMLLPVDANNNLTSSSIENMVFVLGHEIQHSQNAYATNTAYVQYKLDVQSAVAQSVTDFTSIALAYQLSQNRDESIAQISGWNAYVSYMYMKNPNVTAAELYFGTTRSHDFMQDSTGKAIGGMTFDTDNFGNPVYTVTASGENITAQGNQYFLNTNTNLSGSNNYQLTYPARVGRTRLQCAAC